MRKGRKVGVIIIVVLAICCAVIAYLNSNYRYSKMLLNAITIENKVRVQESLEKKSSCVNTYPTFAPI